ncbi:PrgI family protein [Janibacter melonis]|uniref:SCO6880 family protein n=1 Tax=Janibacter melonis TaxID=262209 RepID=UPI0020432CAA|nr:SCO6880 family protein [Janibacter melonis]MCM3556664.1 PrgI family protein [Janibacter melonis]
MALIYSDYSRSRIGWLFGFSGWQMAVVATTFLPIAVSMSRGAWRSVALFALVWVIVTAVTITPVRGRSAVGWLLASLSFAAGGLNGWTKFRADATAGKVGDLAEPDLPGVLQGISIHDGPPQGATFSRIAVIQDHAAKTWALTAAVVHPGIGLAEGETRARHGNGLTELIDLAARTELIDELIFLVRTVPEDGAERDQWILRHRRPDGPSSARQINDELQANLTQASVRSEAFVTFVVPESRIGREAKEAGGGLDGRARVLYGLAGELEAQLRGGMGMTGVTWLSSPDLALACRTGFAPGDRAAVIDALAEKEQHPEVNAEIPWAMAGPSGADPVARHYSHDAWNSISSTIKLPTKGALMGALAGVLTPTEPGERRSFMVAYPILSQSAAERQSATSEWAADIGEELNAKAKRKVRARSRAEAEKIRNLDHKLAGGNALTRPYAVCTVTVPKTQRIASFGRGLDSSIRRAGFAPLRLDLSQDVAFAATNIPLGVSLTRKA